MIDLSRRPWIGVTGPDEGGGAAWWFTRFAIWRAGGRARRITPSQPPGPSELATLDGLVIGGGADVDPALYGEDPPSLTDALREETSAGTGTRGRTGDGRSARWTWGRRLFSVLTLGLRRLSARKRAMAGGDPARDALETELIRDAVAQGKPILGICRGAQLLNVHFGGTLHQDLEAFYDETPQIWTVRPRKRIEVEPESLLAQILRTRVCRVNALHRQAVDRLADDLRAVARERSGVVQGIEHPGLSFVLGVQWHPEYLPQIRRQRRIFERLVEAARGAGTPRSGIA